MPRTASINPSERVQRLYEVAERIARQPHPSNEDMREYARIAKGLSFRDYLQIEEAEARAASTDQCSG